MTDIDTPETPDRSGGDSADRSGEPSRPPVRWPLWIALLLIFGVFVAGAVWSFREQAALARSTGFHLPELLPLTIDGFAVAMAAVAWAASLDGRAAVFARFGVTVGIACSASANGAWAWQRSGADELTVVIASAVPVGAMVAFEVLLAEARRQVQRRRGLPQPEPIAWPRLIAICLAPWPTFRDWRREVLARTSPARQFAVLPTAAVDRSEPPAAQASRPERGRASTGATVTPITRSRPQPTAPRKTRRTGRRTGPAGGRLDDHSPVAVADAEAILDRYGDDIPPRDQVRTEMGWGSPKTGNALKAVPAVRAARRERSTPPAPDRSGDESGGDEESEAVAVG